MAYISDEEWDIPDDQWQVLEHDAILSTQQQQQQQQNNGNGSRHTASGQQTGQTSTERLSTASIRRAVADSRSPQHGYRDTSDQNSFDNPSLDEDGVPLIVEEQARSYAPRRLDETAQREQWRVNRFAQKNIPHPQPQPQPQLRPQTRTIPRQAYQEYQQRQHTADHEQSAQPVIAQRNQPHLQSVLPASQSTQGFHIVKPNPEKESVQSMLERLQREREELAQNLSQAQADLLTARGEISVIRTKSATETKAAERQASISKKQMHDEAAKHKAALQAKDAAYSKLATNSTFLKHELEEQTRKIEILQRQAKENPLREKRGGINMSPQKNIDALRDGFDDDEIMHMSPGRSPARRRPTSKPNTPTKKRKHPTSNASDMPPLVLRLSSEQPSEPPKAAPPQGTVTPFIKDHRTARHLQLLQDVLAFCPRVGRETLVEALASYAYPKEPTRSVGSILLAESSKLKGNRLPADLLAIFSGLLARCVQVEYYEPLNILLDAISHILALDPTMVDALLIDGIINHLQDLSKLNAKIRWTLSQRLKIWADDEPIPKLVPDVDATKCLDVLITLASYIADEPALFALFWKRLETETVLVLLTPCQPIPELTLTLELMATSIRPDSFGNICEPAEQPRIQMYIIDKVCYLLWDPPRQKMRVPRYARDQPPPLDRPSPEAELPPRPSRHQICTFRLHVLELLNRILTANLAHPYTEEANIRDHNGTNAVLYHPSAIARLTRLLYDEVRNLYASQPDTHALHAKIINRAISLLHHILLCPQARDKESDFDLTKALSAVLAGVHRFRVVLTRIVFREGIETVGVDWGITEETTGKAKEILEEYVTPDEAFQLLCAFGKEELDEEMEVGHTEGAAETDVVVDVEE